jgi:hypothetical protein
VGEGNREKQKKNSIREQDELEELRSDITDKMGCE